MTSKTEQAAWQDFLTLCLEAKTENQLDELFHLFFTHAEREDFSKRYILVKALLEGKKTQRELSKETGISIAKITRGSNLLKEMPGKLEKFLREKMLTSA